MMSARVSDLRIKVELYSGWWMSWETAISNYGFSHKSVEDPRG